jgi:hypothetical protein
MPRIDLVKKSPISASGRARQLEGMFDDVPRKKESIGSEHRNNSRTASVIDDFVSDKSVIAIWSRRRGIC